MAASPASTALAITRPLARGTGVDSHPDGPARPSATDVANAYYPNAVQLIISLADRARPSVRAFTIVDGTVAEVGWEEDGTTDYTDFTD